MTVNYSSREVLRNFAMLLKLYCFPRHKFRDATAGQRGQSLGTLSRDFFNHFNVSFEDISQVGGFEG